MKCRGMAVVVVEGCEMLNWCFVVEFEQQGHAFAVVCECGRNDLADVIDSDASGWLGGWCRCK